jgi:HEAT repeat protein
MTQRVTKVRVFVASPGDVQKERDSLPGVVEELNTTLGQRLGFVAELVRWETHCRPAMGRPQGVINEQIGEYDIFIGTMWKRFGSPTGEADSGTEEEFNLAYERWRRDHRLHIAFYFCQAPYTLNSKEEAEQAGKVLGFKNELKGKGLVWEYQDAGVFADTIRRHLYPILLEMFLPTASEAPAEVVNRPLPPAEVPDEQVQQDAGIAFGKPEAAERQTGEQQIAESVSSLGEAVRREDFARGARFSGDLDDFQLLRLQLLMSTWLVAHISSSTLSTHEANRLYLNRERLRPTGPEFVSLLRMLINDHLGYVPGWYWFKGLEEADIELVILDLALSDPHNLVRQRAFELLALSRVPLPDTVRERVAWTVTSDSSPEVRRAALLYVGTAGGQAYLPVVGSALVDRERSVSSQAKVSKYLLLARAEPNRALSELLGETDVEVKDILDELLRGAREIAAATLLKALGHSNDEVRFFAIEELNRRGELTAESALDLKGDKYDPVKAAAYRLLVERGSEVEDKEIVYDLPVDYFGRLASRNLISRPRRPINREQIVLNFYRRYDAGRLAQMTGWDQLAGHEAYRALAVEHFPEFAERLREDLRTDFAADAERYYRSELEEWQRMAATPINRAHASSLIPTELSLLSALKQTRTEREKPTPESMARSSVEGRKAYYVAAALAGLARNGSHDDSVLIRRFLSHDDNDVRIEAVSALRRCGDADDVRALVEIAEGGDGLLQELSAEAALTLAGDRREVAARFFATGDEILVSVTVTDLIAHGNTPAVGEFLRPYLYNPDEKVRTRVMAFFISRYEKRELEDLLALYTGEEVYYYDVVCCFDRILYAPPRLRRSYHKTVENGFFGLL